MPNHRAKNLSSHIHGKAYTQYNISEENKNVLYEMVRNTPRCNDLTSQDLKKDLVIKWRRYSMIPSERGEKRKESGVAIIKLAS